MARTGKTARELLQKVGLMHAKVSQLKYLRLSVATYAIDFECSFTKPGLMQVTPSDLYREISRQ